MPGTEKRKFPALAHLLIIWLSTLSASAASAHSPGVEQTLIVAIDPYSITLLLILLVLYLRGIASLRKKKPLRRTRHVLFMAGWVSLAVALLPPVDTMSGELFSMHMVQHELMMLLAAPLLVFSHPAALLIRGMPEFFRRKFIWLLRRKSTLLLRRLILLPSIAWLIHALALWGWHVPWMFQASLESELIHTLQHSSFFVSALVFWWACSGNRYREIGVAVFLFTTAAHASLLGALLTFSNTVWYPHYLNTAPAWGLSALQDQQLGGLIMWVPGGLVFLLMSLHSLMGLVADVEGVAARGATTAGKDEAVAKLL
jgi:putative membrane protein